ncbi:DUF2971 domain-containing protein [Empedobacter brevis]|uniref:DUF2971 domain-containing protein n=1 Tax=Empedobacter brevis TaxID=247 RepID=UPI0023F39E16|nr:DUF2971 domain-containing protein [Empedobacter brevis]
MFHTPENNIVVWRYIDFTKFVDLLTSSKLFFCRSDNFDDPFEGILQLKDYEQTRDMFKLETLTKKFYFINCWHINNHQSDAMWRIFLNTNNGIAIKTTVGNIIKSFEKSDDDVYIGKVYYKDFEQVTFNDLMFEPQNIIFNGRGGSVSQFNYKRISFEHEKELRLFHIDMPIPHAIKGGIPRDPLSHKHINVNLNELIQEIVIAPFADIWFEEMVERLLNNLNLNFKIVKSNLYKLKE